VFVDTSVSVIMAEARDPDEVDVSVLTQSEVIVSAADVLAMSVDKLLQSYAFVLCRMLVCQRPNLSWLY